jgi:hypothetical protein
MNANTQRPAAPAECKCTVVRVATLAETLNCPAVWMVLPAGCFHVLPARRRAVAR